MAKYIIHKDGVYNIWSTIVDAPCYDGGLTLEKLREVVKEEQGQEGLRHLPDRLKRAHATGSSSLCGSTLDTHIAVNRAGPGESQLSPEEFVRQYLTLPARLDEKTEVHFAPVGDGLHAGWCRNCGLHRQKHVAPNDSCPPSASRRGGRTGAES